METAAIDFVPWGLEAAWPSRRWLEPVDGRRDGPPRGVRLGHASDSALVLVCTYPRFRFDAEMPGTGADLVRELAFETTFALINFALHQIKEPGGRPAGLVGSLVSYANQQADRYLDWGTTYWGMASNGPPGPAAWPGQAVARTIGLGGWRSGFSIANADAYIVVHACGVSLDHLLLTPATDPSAYGLEAEPPLLGQMHWELWPNHQELSYDDLLLPVGAH
jgi:hypothetical protein